MENYLIIRVTEPDTEGSTQTAMLRRAIHNWAVENGIDLADNIIRAHRKTFLNGQPVPYKEAQELFKKVMFKGNKK